MSRRSAFMIWLLLAVGGCISPICADGFVASEARCIAESEQKCSDPCNADAHEVCDTSQEEPMCACAPGYEGSTCEWVGVLRYPGFDQPDNDRAWSVTNGATVKPFDVGPNDDGVASLDPSVVCSGGAVSQMVEMPPLDAADPLVAEVTYRAQGVHGIAVGFGRAWKRLAPTQEDEWTTTRFCLGEAAYGGTVQVQVASSEKTSVCNLAPVELGTIEVDRLSIKLANADECPVPGEVLNGQTDASEGGWEFLSTGDATAGFDESAGREGSGGARLYSPTGLPADIAAMTTEISVPLPGSTISPALRFWWKGTSGRFFQTELGTFIDPATSDRTLGTLVGNGSGQDYIYCLPPWTHGNVVELSFLLNGGGPAEEIEIVVDEVAVVADDARCAIATDIHDPDFESAPNRRPGVRLFGAAEQSFQTVSDSERAHSGDGFLEISYWTTAAIAIVETWVFVPPPDEQGGPQVTFYSNVPADPELQTRWVVGLVAELEADLPTGGGWRLNEACLPPRWSNRWYRFQVWVGGFGGSATTIDPPKAILVDDFALTTSSRCPSE